MTFSILPVSRSSLFVEPVSQLVSGLISPLDLFIYLSIYLQVRGFFTKFTRLFEWLKRNKIPESHHCIKTTEITAPLLCDAPKCHAKNTRLKKESKKELKTEYIKALPQNLSMRYSYKRKNQRAQRHGRYMSRVNKRTSQTDLYRYSWH